MLSLGLEHLIDFPIALKEQILSMTYRALQDWA